MSLILENAARTLERLAMCTFDPMLFSSEHHLMRIGDMLIWNKKVSHPKTLKRFYNLNVGEELNNHYIGGDYYQISRPDENNYLLVKYDQYSLEVGRVVVSRDFLAQCIVDSV